MKIEKAKLLMSANLDVCIDGKAKLGTVSLQWELQLRGKIIGEESWIELSNRQTMVEIYKTAGPR